MSNIVFSDVASAFQVTGGPAAHPEDQNEEENEENLRKNAKLRENEERLRKCSYLSHPGVRGCLRPWLENNVNAILSFSDNYVYVTFQKKKKKKRCW